MLGLWKTVKIYHSQSQSRMGGLGLKQVVTSCQEIKTKQNSRQRKTEKLQPRTRTLESFTLSPKRQGICVSMTESREQVSPKRIKMVTSNQYKPVPLVTRQNSNLADCNPNQSPSAQILIDETTLIKTSPHHYQCNQIRDCQHLTEQNRNNFSFNAVKKNFDQIANRDILEQSPRNSRQRIYLTIGAKKMGSQRQNNVTCKPESKTNDGSNKMRSTIDSFGNSSLRLNRQKQTSILRLSSTNVKQSVFQVQEERSSETCSQQLQRSSYMHGYVDEVTESIIVDTASPLEKGIKGNQSSKGLRDIGQADIFQPAVSAANQREINSSSLKFKKRNGEAITLFDKKTILSKSILSQTSPRQLVYESTIIEHEISSRFDPLPRSCIDLQQCRILLVKERMTGMLFSAKQIPAHRAHSVTNQLRIYQQFEQLGWNAKILSFYQMYIHHGLYVLIKQPYQLTLQQFILTVNQSEHTIELMLRNIQDTLSSIVAAWQHKSIQLIRPINSADIVFKLEEWKLHSPDMFGSTRNGLSVDEAMKPLRKQIILKTRKFQANSR